MPTYHLTLLGRPVLAGPAGPIPIRVRKVQALLFYLAAQSRSHFSRSHLAGLLWENSPEQEALRNLRLALHRLRQALPVWPVRVSHSSLAWDAEAGVQLDTDSWLILLQQENAISLAAAVALRRGPLLDGFEIPDSIGFTNWLAAERQLWDERVLAGLERLIHLSEEDRAWRLATGYARQALAIDPLAERFHRQLMLAHYQAGERAAALAAFATCRAILQEDLGVAPDPNTRALYDDIRAQRIPLLLARGRAEVAPPFPAAGPRPRTPDVLPLVGREQELAAAFATVRDAHLGQVRALLISGEAGIGKSRLVAELMAKVAGLPGTLLLGHCYEAMGTVPFAPIASALRQVLPKADLGGNRLPAAWLREVARLLPELAENRPDLQKPPRHKLEQNREGLLEGVARFLAVLPPPITLCVEDLHWADDATLQLLGYLARRQVPAEAGPGLAMAMVFSCRPGEERATVRDLLAELEREGTLSRIELTALSAAAIGELVAAATGTADPALAERLFAVSDGNAFYAVELLRALQVNTPESGNSVALAGIPLPRTVQALIRRRLERLPPLARELVTAAAIFRRPADFDRLAQMTAIVAEAIPALESALAAGILVQMQPPGEARSNTSATYGLHHELIRRVVIGDLSAARLRSLHQKAFAQILRHSGAQPDQVGQRGGHTPELAEELAAHALAGELWEPAAKWLQAAAGAAEQVFAYPEAARFLEQSLHCLEQLPPAPARTQTAVDIRLRLGNMSDLLLPRRAQARLAHVEEDALALGDEERQAAATLAQGQLLIAQGHTAVAVSLLTGLLPIARRLQGLLLAQALSLLGTAQLIMVEYEAARANLNESISLFGAVGISEFTYRQARASLVWVLVLVGEFDAALDAGHKLLDECRRWGDPAGIAQATTAVANAALRRGNWRLALMVGREGVEAAEKTDYRFYGYVNAMTVGPAQIQLGDLAGGVCTLEEVVALAEREGVGVLLYDALQNLGIGYLLAQRFADAEAVLRRGHQLAAAGGARHSLHVLDRALAQVYAATGREGEARELLHAAVAGLQGIGARPEEARCHACLAALAETKVERQAHYLQAEQMFREMGMDWDLEQLRTASR